MGSTLPGVAVRSLKALINMTKWLFWVVCPQGVCSNSGYPPRIVNLIASIFVCMSIDPTSFPSLLFFSSWPGVIVLDWVPNGRDALQAQTSEWKQGARCKKKSVQTQNLACVCWFHYAVLFTRRHQAQPGSVPILYRETHKLSGVTK